MTLERKTHVYADRESLHFRFGVIGERGGVELQFRVMLSDPLPPMLDRVGIGGFEIHSRTPFPYSDAEPYHADCWFIGGPCWHDGTSLWAQEYWMPGFLEGGTDWLWPRLEREYAERFEDQPKVAAE